MHTLFVRTLFTNGILWSTIYWLLNFFLFFFGCCSLNLHYVSYWICLSLFRRSCMTTVLNTVCSHFNQSASSIARIHIRQLAIYIFQLLFWEIFSIPVKTGNFWFSASSLTILRTVELKPSEPFLSPNLIIISSMRSLSQANNQPTNEQQQHHQKKAPNYFTTNIAKMLRFSLVENATHQWFDADRLNFTHGRFA